MKHSVTYRGCTFDIEIIDEEITDIKVGGQDVNDGILSEGALLHLEAYVQELEPEDGSQEAEDLAMERKHGYY